MRERLGRALIKAAPVGVGAPAAGSNGWCNSVMDGSSSVAVGLETVREWNDEVIGRKRKEKEAEKERWPMEARGVEAAARRSSAESNRGLAWPWSRSRRPSLVRSARREHHPGVSERDAVPLDLLRRALGARGAGGRSGGRRAGRRRRPRRTAAHWFSHDEFCGIFAQIPAPRVHVAVLSQTATVDVANGEGNNAALCGRTQAAARRDRNQSEQSIAKRSAAQSQCTHTRAHERMHARQSRCVFMCL